MEILLRATNKRVKQKVIQDFQWYDTHTQKVLRGRGGEMRFRYNPALKRSVPYVVDAEEWITENNYEKITDWVENSGFPILSSAKSHFVMIDVPAGEFDDVTRELYTKNILFDWEGD
jgi:hypothetical protein